LTVEDIIQERVRPGRFAGLTQGNGEATLTPKSVWSSRATPITATGVFRRAQAAKPHKLTLRHREGIAAKLKDDALIDPPEVVRPVFINLRESTGGLGAIVRSDLSAARLGKSETFVGRARRSNSSAPTRPGRSTRHCRGASSAIRVRESSRRRLSVSPNTIKTTPASRCRCLAFVRVRYLQQLAGSSDPRKGYKAST
jgi:hypothetical protein